MWKTIAAMKIATLLLAVASGVSGCATAHLSLFGPRTSEGIRVDLAGGPDHDYRVRIKDVSSQQDRLIWAKDYLRYQCSSMRLVKEHVIKTEDVTLYVLELTCNR